MIPVPLQARESLVSAVRRNRFVGLYERVLQDGSTECFAVYDDLADADRNPAEEAADDLARVTDRVD